jgi:hypothetical protein
MLTDNRTDSSTEQIKEIMTDAKKNKTKSPIEYKNPLD